MTAYYGTITPKMTEEEKKEVVLRAIFMYPNFPVIAKKLGCGRIFVESVADEYGIERTYLTQPKFQEIKARVEAALRSTEEEEKGRLFKRISTQLSVPIETVNSVAAHVERVKSLRSKECFTGDSDVAEKKQKAATEILQKRPSSGKRKREKALSDESAYEERRNALLELAGVHSNNPKRSAMRATDKAETTAEIGSGPG